MVAVRCELTGTKEGNPVNMMETMIGIALAALMIGTMLEWSDDHTQEGEAQLMAATMDELNEGVKHYMQSEFETLAECMALATHVNQWSDDFEADTGIGGMTYGREASAWYAIPLYDNDPGLSDPNWRAARSECGDDPWVITSAPLGWLPSLFETGFLPAGLGGLRHTATPEDETWGTRGLRLRVYLRWVNASRRDIIAGSPARPMLESMLVAATDSETTLSRSLVQGVMRASTTADVGAVTSQGVGTVVSAHTHVYGVNGGWERELCLSDTPTASVPQGSIVRCPPGIGTGGREPGLDADVIALNFGNGGGGRVANRGEPFLSADPGLATNTELSGKGSADTVESGRLVYMGLMRPESKLADMLYRRDVGVPELNRMETDLNFGGYGGLNAAFFAGIDIDGDGVPDEGLHIVGPPVYEDIDDDGTVTAAERAAGVERRKRPTVVHGDLTVLGNLQVGGEEPAFGANALGIEKAQTVGGEFTTGNVHAFGSMHLGPGEFDAKTLRRGETTAEITAGHLLVTGSTQIGGLEFDQGITTGTGMSTHPGSLLVAANTQVGLERTGTVFGDTRMHPTLTKTNRWLPGALPGTGTWAGSGTWTVGASAQGVVWSRHVLASANPNPFVAAGAEEGRIIAEHGVRIGMQPPAWSANDDIASDGGLEVRTGAGGRDALLAIRNDTPTNTWEMRSTNVPGQAGRRPVKIITERDPGVTTFEMAQVLFDVDGTLEADGDWISIRAKDTAEVHGATPTTAGAREGASRIILDATTIDMDTGGALTMDATGEITATAGGAGITATTTGPVTIDAGEVDVDATTSIWMTSGSAMELEARTLGVVTTGPIFIDATGSGGYIDVNAGMDVTVNAENINMQGRKKFTWGALDIDIIANQHLRLEATKRDVTVDAPEGKVTVSAKGAGLPGTPGPGRGVQIKNLNTQHSNYTGAPGGWNKLSSTIPGFVPRLLLRQSGSSGQLTKIGGIDQPCDEGSRQTFTAAHGWQRSEGAMYREDANFIYVHSLTATRASPTQTDIRVQRQQVRFRAYLKPFSGWAMRNIAETSLKDIGTPGNHEIPNGKGVQGEMLAGCLNP